LYSAVKSEDTEVLERYRGAGSTSARSLYVLLF